MRIDAFDIAIMIIVVVIIGLTLPTHSYQWQLFEYKRQHRF